ncbi:MAG TPA: thiamine diphosphokinase [Candidatus Limnocylindrales bacterium]|nr:thiamine diphosphokinase [Candidatus Limnocylindrales bacterium]
MKVVVVAHGAVHATDRRYAADADLVVAADGGALHLRDWGLRPHVVVGDLDSLSSDVIAGLRRDGVEVDARDPAKDESDTELALARAIAADADEITLIGALGGPRLDHELANVLLLADPAYGGALIRARLGPTSLRVLRGGGCLSLEGAPGGVVTLLPLLGDAEGVRAEGLRFPLAGERLRFGRSRGLSNEIVSSPAAVACGAGTLLVIETAQGGT